MKPTTDDASQGGFPSYPTNRVLAILASPKAADSAVNDLVAGGIPAGDIEAVCGEAGLREIDFTGKRHGVLARIIRAVQDIGELAEYRERFEQALRAGECLVAVDAEEPATRQLIRERLKASGARYINFFGTLGVERLEA
jgi:hypothetical protein